MWMCARFQMALHLTLLSCANTGHTPFEKQGTGLLLTVKSWFML